MSNIKEGIWLNDKPVFDKECMMITATKVGDNWESNVWQVKKLDGENEEGQPAWYWGLLTGDGEEWGDINELRADKYYIMPSITIG